MTINRFLKYINLLIGASLVAVLAGLWWFVWRALPVTAGELSAPVAAAVRVGRDENGVPHIAAESLEDALFAQGFVTAQDRFFQMELVRRHVAGELAEIFGPRAVASDIEFRHLNLYEMARRLARNMRAGDRAAMAAYARGVNYYLESNLDRLPVEFRVLRYDPAPWSIADSILVGLNMFVGLSSTWKSELLKEQMAEAGDPAKVEFLFPLGGGAEQPGSNAWVIGGAHTASGGPILANDTHLQPSLPGIWYMVHLEAPGLAAAGVSLPGMPGVILGRNRRIAWGVTNLHFDVQDLYRLEGDEAQSAVRAARVEQIRVRGGQPVQAPVVMTVYGPVVHRDEKRLYALRWLAAGMQRYEYPILDINRAANWEEFRAALARFPGPAQNFLYADVEGNLGYQGAGALPVRRGCRGDVPVTKECEWSGAIPFDELPRAFNPAGGRIVTANENPFPLDYPYPVRGHFATPYRSRQIDARLAARDQWRAEDMLAVQMDVYSAFHHWLARECVAALGRREQVSPDLAEAGELLKSWGGRMEIGEAAPVIAELTFRQLRTVIADNAAPGKGAEYEFQTSPLVVERLLRERPEGWFDDFDGLIVESLEKALAEGRDRLRREPRRWNYGQLNAWRLGHPLFAGIPIAGRYMRIGPVAMSGAATTVKQVTGRVGPSMRMVVDLGDSASSLLNVTTGQSAHFLSRHYRDQWDAFYTGRSFPMRFDAVEARKTLMLHPR